MNELVNTKLTIVVNTMTNAVNELIKSNQSMMKQWINMDNLAFENQVLNTKFQRLEYEQSKIDNIENKGLENCLIMRGISESKKCTRSYPKPLMFWVNMNIYKKLKKWI